MSVNLNFMRLLFVLLILTTIVEAKIYYAKVEPYEIRTISSNVSGVVTSADDSFLGKTLTKEHYIKIDSDIDERELRATKEKLMYITNALEMNEAILANLDDLLVKKRDNCREIESSGSKLTIDKEFYDLIASENQHLNTLKEIQNFKVQISDLKLKQVKLRKTIADKNLAAEGFMLCEMFVKSGEFVEVSAPLAKIADVSKAKLTIYVDEDDTVNIENKTVYIDGEKTSYKVSRFLHIADSKDTSKYMVQIIIKSPELFSKLVKVELRDKE